MTTIEASLKDTAFSVDDPETQIPLFLKMSAIDEIKMGPVSKVTVVVHRDGNPKGFSARMGGDFLDGVSLFEFRGLFPTVVMQTSLHNLSL